MELQFEKTVVPCLRTVVREMQAQELTQEVRLMDGMPDIGKVLASWGQILIRGKQWHNGMAGVNGGIMVWVLYLPEEGNEPQSVETWIPFQCKWDVSNATRDGNICIEPFLRGVDARSLSARKLMVRAGMGVLGEATVPSEAEFYTPGDLSEDVQLLRNTYAVQLPVEAGEKPIMLDEMLTLPTSSPELSRLVRYSLRPELIDKKVVADKVVMRGACAVNALYMGTDERLHNWDFEIPFSQYAQLDKEHENSSDAEIKLAVTDLEMEQTENGLHLKAGMTGQYTIYDRPVFEVVEDAYSPRREIVVRTTRSDYPAVLDMSAQTVSAQQQAEMDVQEIVDLSFYPDYPLAMRDGDAVNAQLSGMFQVLGYDQSGQLRSATAHWEDDWSLPVDENARVELSAQQTGDGQASANGSVANMHADLRINSKTFTNEGMKVVSGLDMGEMKEQDTNRPSLILRRAGDERLWDIAKSTGSTVAAIMGANELEQEPESDQILLIPVS